MKFIKSKDFYSKSIPIVGAIAGDIIGSVYEWNNIKTTEFPLFSKESDFTDDTVLTIAIADSLISKKDFSDTLLTYGRKYTNRGYGGKFNIWLDENVGKPYGSYGNGSAMRVSAVGVYYNSLDDVLEKAKQTAEVTHNHPEGIKGAQAVASAIFLARKNKSKNEIKDYITEKFNYDLNFTLDSIRDSYSFDVTCQGSVPQALVSFLESSDFESAIRLAVSIGGDSDTIACITGGVAAAYYKKIPENIIDNVNLILPDELKEVLNKFEKEISKS